MQKRPLTEEEQAAFNRLAGAAVYILYDPEFIPAAVEMLQAAPSPESGVADLAVAIGTRVLNMAKENGMVVPGGALLMAGAKLLDEIQEFSDEFAGMKVSDQQMQAALLDASDRLAESAQSGVVRVDMDQPNGLGVQQ